MRAWPLRILFDKNVPYSLKRHVATRWSSGLGQYALME
jgi:hypothetical protein